MMIYEQLNNIALFNYGLEHAHQEALRRKMQNTSRLKQILKYERVRQETDAKILQRLFGGK